MKEQEAGEGLLVEDVHIQRRENRCTPTFRLRKHKKTRPHGALGRSGQHLSPSGDLNVSLAGLEIHVGAQEGICLKLCPQHPLDAWPCHGHAASATT